VTEDLFVIINDSVSSKTVYITNRNKCVIKIFVMEVTLDCILEVHGSILDGVSGHSD